MLALWQACFTANVEEVRSAIDRGEDVNGKGGTFNATCLMTAVNKGAEGIVELLLQQPSCDLSVQDSYGFTALHYACDHGLPGIVRRLATHPRQGSLDSRSNGGWTALMKAAAKGREECVRELLRIPVLDVNLKNHQEKTALMLAVEVDSVECVRELVTAHRVDLQTMDGQGKTLQDVARLFRPLGKECLLFPCRQRGNSEVMRLVIPQASLPHLSVCPVCHNSLHGLPGGRRVVSTA